MCRHTGVTRCVLFVSSLLPFSVFGNVPVDLQHKGNHEKHLSTEKRRRVIGALLGRCGLLVRMACFLKKCTKLGARRTAQRAREEPERAWVTQW